MADCCLYHFLHVHWPCPNVTGVFTCDSGNRRTVCSCNIHIAYDGILNNDGNLYISTQSRCSKNRIYTIRYMEKTLTPCCCKVFPVCCGLPPAVPLSRFFAMNWFPATTRFSSRTVADCCTVAERLAALFSCPLCARFPA